MVKRKADIGLEEWLTLGADLSEVREASTAAAKHEGVQDPISTDDSGTPEAKAEVAAVTPTDETQIESDIANWFWLLLERAGYEIW